MTFRRGQRAILHVLLNGPTENPKGKVFGGGPFTDFEGTEVPLTGNAGFYRVSGK